MQKILKNILPLIILGVFVFIFKDKLFTQFLQLRDQFFPCRSPITYTIGIFDDRFGISRADFLATTKQVEEIWEKPIKRNLFEAETTGRLKINLLYDYRQDATEKLQVLDLSVDKSQSSYDLIEARYTTRRKQYLADEV